MLLRQLLAYDIVRAKFGVAVAREIVPETPEPDADSQP
jgi:hypothetical protein